MDICYKCGTDKVVMASIYAYGQYYMCDTCIRKEENETGKVAVFSGLYGLEFVDREELKTLGIQE